MSDRPPTREADVAPGHGAGDDFDALVGRTEGAQPWRRVFHTFNGLLTATVLSFLPVTRRTALWILAGVAVGLVTMDLVRLRHTRANSFFFRAFRHLASPREADGPASSSWYALGLFVTVALFSREAAVSGILMLALADPAASYVGRRWGRRPFLGASLEGTGVFLVVSMAVLLPRHAWPVAVGAALVAALSERLGWPLDDNFVIPVVGALAITLLQIFA